MNEAVAIKSTDTRHLPPEERKAHFHAAVDEAVDQGLFIAIVVAPRRFAFSCEQIVRGMTELTGGYIPQPPRKERKPRAIATDLKGGKLL